MNESGDVKRKMAEKEGLVYAGSEAYR